MRNKMGLFSKPKYQTYIDENGYKRYADSKRLVHRHIAQKYIYDRNIYPLPFGKYIIHHKNGNKLDNRTENLLIITQGKHGNIHGINFGNDNWTLWILFLFLIIAIIFMIIGALK